MWRMGNQRLRRVLGVLALAVLPVVATPAAASELRFSQTAAGQIVATGNTLGLSKEFGLNGPGVEDSIGTFITLDPALVDANPPNPGNPWGLGTTGDWTLNGSTADLQIPVQVEVLYAELVWGGSREYDEENVTASIDDPVTLSFGGDSLLVAPDPVTDLDITEIAFSGFPVNYYMRTAEVTQFVADHLSGTYAVSGVPATQTTAINSLNAAGWTLLVAYRDSSEPIRNLTLFVGGSFVDEDSTEFYDFAGFCTPPAGPFSGRAVVSTIEGDADIVGDSFEIGETVAGPFTTLSGPNNPADNFFCSQLNDSTGALDMSGTMGGANQNAAGGFNVVAGRQGWDVTTVAVSSGAGHFSNGQTEAVLRAVTTGDSFIPIATGFAIEINAPDFTEVGNQVGAMPLALELSQSSTVTIDLQNTGLVDATGIVFRAPLPMGLELASFAIDGSDGDASGTPVDTAGMAAGVAIGNVASQQARQLVFEVTATGAPANGIDYPIAPQWEYDYVSCAGEPPLSEPHSTVPIVIDFIPPEDTGGADTDSGMGTGTGPGGVDETGPGMGSASGGGSAGASDSADTTDGVIDLPTTSGFVSGTSSGGGLDEPGGCGCRQHAPRPGWAWLLWLMPVAARRRR